ncbi:hypothetical protein G6O69_24280 [Pseudenhygromyxa sp. WMMC2535]|uniref:hypothetical protein n=1 Tax=Pseudenhygromyxa sp. WMMC2535 TaxID=2712867 RepID=UPI0015544183|nr:hypothetical protein [Pseudenhygromyxa sp. WMMC2535]NVB40980.1 hypothetical protein [Pseudenhygromyxa sp. WMMC2535]
MASSEQGELLVNPRAETESGFTGFPRRFTELVIEERWFIGILAVCFAVAGAVYPYPQVAMWVGFLFAGYAVIANDSIQTIGTFIASNKHRPWWVLWLFIGGVMLVTVAYSWFAYDGDVTYGRLASKGFSTAPTSFVFLQVAGPLFLLILTRLRMPVSTTFLLLSCFATEPAGVGSVLQKSLIGYVLAFVLAIAVWFAAGRLIDRKFTGRPHPAWHVGLWVSTSLLWCMWLVQDAANVAVFLPRQLSLAEFAVFAAVLFFGLALLFKLGGDKIQQVVEEKAAVSDVRHATTVSAVYGVILFVFKVWSEVPMSTTWVFIGLLAGREIALNATKAHKIERRSRREVTKLILRDLIYVTTGLVVSLGLAVLVSPELQTYIFGGG